MLEELRFKFEHHEYDFLVVPDELALMVREHPPAAAVTDDRLDVACEDGRDVVVRPQRLHHRLPRPSQKRFLGLQFIHLLKRNMIRKLKKALPLAEPYTSRY